MAGEADLQPSKGAKNAATRGKKQGSDIKKKKQSCSNNETSHKEKKINDNCGNDNEEEVLKMKDDKFSDIKGIVNIKKSEKCNCANHDKGSLKKNDVHMRKDVLKKETDSFIMGVTSSEERSSKDTNKKGKDGLNDGEVPSIKIDSNDVIEKEMVNKSNIEGIDKLDLENQVMIKEKDIHNNNNESHKKDNEVKAVSVDRDEDIKKKVKESADKEDYVPPGGNDLASTEEKDSSNKNSPKKRQFGYNRGRGSYGNSRGRNFNWMAGWGHNYSRYPNRRMMNTAYRGHTRPCNNYSESAQGHLKASSPLHPEVSTPAITGSLQPVYFDSQINHQDCYYFPQVWPPQQQGQTLSSAGYQGSNDIASAQANMSACKPYVGDDNQSADMDAIELSKENVNVETNGRENFDLQKPPVNRELGQSETSNQMNAEANQAIEGHGMTSNIIASVSSNPLCELGKSVEHDKQLVQTFACIEMRPSTQLPPGYGLQWYFIPYGAALPPSVIPVMVVPFLNPSDSVGNQYHPGQDGNGGHDKLCPPPQSLLPSYFNSMDVHGHFQTASPVDTYQPAVHTWPNQMMNPMAAGNPEYFIQQVHSSQTDFYVENKFQAK